MGCAPPEAIARLSKMEPFDAYPEVVAALAEKAGTDQ